MKKLILNLGVLSFLIAGAAFADKNSCKESCNSSYKSAISSSKSTGDSCRSCCSSAGKKYGPEYNLCTNRCSQTQNAEYEKIHKDMYLCHHHCN